MGVTRYASGLNQIEENLSNVIVTGNNGTVLTRDKMNTAINYKTISVGVTDNLHASEHYQGNYIVGGENGTLLSVNETNFAVLPVDLSNSASVKSSFGNVTFKSIDVKKVGNDYRMYVVGTKGTVLYSPNIVATKLAGQSNFSDGDFNSVQWKVSSNIATAVGSNSTIYTLAQLFATKTKNIFTAEARDVHFGDVNVGTVVGDHYLLRSTVDGGITWKVHHDASPSYAKTSYLKKTWTVKRPDGKHFAFVGGQNTFDVLSNNQITPYYAGLFNNKMVSDFNFHPSNKKEGFLSTLTGQLLPLHLTANNTTGDWDVLAGYTPTSSPILTTGLPSNTKAIHMFENKAVLAVGNASAKFIQPNGTVIVSNPISYNQPTEQLNDVFFHDDINGYLVGDNGKFYVLKNVNSLATPDFKSTLKNIQDPIIGNSNNYNVKCIAFATRYDGIYGGNHTNMADPLVLNSSFVRTLHHEASQFSARFYYDKLGRLVVSQNSRQAAQAKYSYTRYDNLGRVIEVGEKTENVNQNPPYTPLFKGIFGTYVGTSYIPSMIDDVKMANWLFFQSPSQFATRLEVTRSFYDKSYSQIASQLPASFTPDPLTQRKRITHVTYEEIFDGIENTYDHATHYDYDIHGNVKTLLQDNRLIASVNGVGQHRFKRFDYVFDLVSGNVHRMDYQTGEADQWHHSYDYDADNRITAVFTTASTPMLDQNTGILSLQNEPGLSTYWEREASYNYYAHGPLARTTIGEQEVQGIDYAYTLQGWLKGINSNSLQVGNDIGKDGLAGSANKKVGRDVASFSLHYFQGDYKSIGGSSNDNFIASLGAGEMLNNTKNLYNGNIGRMITTITNPKDREVLPMGNVYRYDQLQRLRESVSYVGLKLNLNDWLSSQSGNHFRNEFTYDANGNIETQLRYKFGMEYADRIDSLSYKYNVVNGHKIQNRLYHVKDSGNSDPEELSDMGQFYAGGNINTANNYRYDQEGRLIVDKQDSIKNITWRVDGKVKKITRIPGSGKKALSFDYDAMGNRIAKHVYDDNNNLQGSTYYLLDAQGNTISTYERKIDNVNQTITFAQTEKHIYGSSRLGVMNVELPMLDMQNAVYSQKLWTHTIGARTYEISNHLGNVLSVISDKPIPHDDGVGVVDFYLADLRSSQDYSPFGVTLKERAFVLEGAEDYRYGFQGQEHDDEIKGKGNSLNYKYRMHDPRLGRFFAVDPLTNTYPYLSPYHFSHNSPIYMIEIEGLEGTIYVYKIWTDNSGYHVSSKPIDSYVVEGLKSNVNKALIMPYGEPNGKAVQIKYSSAAPNGGSLTIDANNKPTVKGLNEFFGDKMPIKEKSSKSFAQKFNDMAPSWARDGAMEGGDDAGNRGGDMYGEKGFYEKGLPLLGTTLGVILSGGTLAIAELSTSAAIITWGGFVNGVDDMTSTNEGRTLFVRGMEAAGMDPKYSKTLKTIVAVADTRNTFINHLNTLSKGKATISAIETFVSGYNTVNTVTGTEKELKK